MTQKHFKYIQRFNKHILKQAKLRMKNKEHNIIQAKPVYNIEDDIIQRFPKRKPKIYYGFNTISK